MVRRIRRRSFVALAAAAIAWSLAGPTTALADDETQTFALNVTCESAQVQLCTPAQTVRVTTLGALRVEVVASPGHCSGVIAHVLVDGVERFVSDELAPGGSTGFRDLGPVDPGEHQVGVQGEGVIGGCNQGGVANWGGTLNVVVSTAAAATPTPPPPPPTGGPVASATPGGAGSSGGDGSVLLFIVVAGLLGAVALGYLLLRRRSAADEASSPPDPIIPPNPVVESDQSEPRA